MHLSLLMNVSFFAIRLPRISSILVLASALLSAGDLAWRATEAHRAGGGHDVRITRQVLLQCVKLTPESLFGDVPNLDVYKAINLAMNRVERKANRPSRRC